MVPSSPQLPRRSRDLAWDGLLNARDLGGHATEDGGETRWGQVVRADSVRQLSDDGWKAVVDYGIRTVVDLRSEEELAADPPAELPVDAVHVPFFDQDPKVFEEVEEASVRATSHAEATREVYLIFLEHFRRNVAAAIRAVAQAPAGGVVVHCHGGKDRTGLVTAFLLRVAGVPATRSGSQPPPTRPRSRDCTASRRPQKRPWSRCSRSWSAATAASRGTCEPAAPRRRTSSAPAPVSVAEVIAIFGPTATGKSEVAEALAERIPARLISADAMQVYRGVPVLTNQSDYPTELVGIWGLDHEASVGEYADLAHAEIDRALEDGVTPVVVGGTGLYLRAALVELALPPAPAPGERERWERTYDELGAQAAHEALAERDPEAAARIHANDRRRVVRALELAEAGASLAPSEARLWSEQTRHPTLLVGLEVPMDVLERRIQERTKAMLERGAEAEARRALAGPISATARTIHGLEEVAELPLDEAFAALVRRTRRYAAYQRKWMRRIPGLVSLPADRPPSEVADAILEVARARQRLSAGPARRPGRAADA